MIMFQLLFAATLCVVSVIFVMEERRERSEIAALDARIAEIKARMVRIETESLEEVAHHEAGHVIMAHILGLKVLLVEASEFSGITRYMRPPGYDVSLLHAAGIAAEFVLRGQWPEQDPSQDGSDAALLAAVSDVKEVMRQAEAIIRWKWDDVRRVAEAMMNRRTLSENDLAQLGTAPMV
jgi:ATP-dependent Zn protease